MGCLEPHGNRSLITLDGFALRLLRTEAELTHEFANVIRVEINACDALADIRDARSCPTIHGEPPVQRSEFHSL